MKQIDTKKIDISLVKRVHFVGIKGVAMTAMAIWAKERGLLVTGSDVEEEFPTDKVLRRNGIAWKDGFSNTHLSDKVDLVIVTGAHGGMTNIEAQTAIKLGIPTLMQGEALGMIMKKKQAIAVAGSHGKTTTSAIIAHILVKSGMDPSYVVGCGEITSLSRPAHAGNGKYFIAEADEYINCPLTDRIPKFSFLNQQICVITNIEFDHPDAYKDIAEVEQSFLAFARKTDKNGLIVLCIDSISVQRILNSLTGYRVVTYGMSPQADFQVDRVSFGDGVTYFWVKHGGRVLNQFTLKIPGRHNCLNALAASIVAAHAGIPWEELAPLLVTFVGSKRRFELIKEANNISLYDDYAHHPTEIKATLLAARAWFPEKRIIAIFQPHTYSRTRALFNEFARAFFTADIAIISDIYPSAREEKDPTISSDQLVDAMRSFHPKVLYRPDKESVLSYIDSQVRPGDIILTLGAGDIYGWLPDLSKILER